MSRSTHWLARQQGRGGEIAVQSHNCEIECRVNCNSVEHFAIIEALRKINISETYVQMLEKKYRHTTARMHIDNLVSKEFHVKRGVRQGDPISPKLFAAAIEEIF
ncbi:reverse transcriptase [Elysia marginata]|uniref:Reverse transcriptase n=1 Tax=Elysia marginata TaxID=1093978 RepID=A0AAV4JXP7_9GAST|nr:reverse transcriptase [Elysia marginata]